MRHLRLAAAALFLAGCSDSTAPPVATRVTVAPEAVSLDALGATSVVHAAVLDQNDKAMPGEAITWSSSSAAVTVAGAGGDSAVVTAVGNGAATVSASAGSASGSVQVQVAQAPASFAKIGGDVQFGIVGMPLDLPLRVVVRDRLNAPVQGTQVTFGVATGGGSVSAASAVTGADGTAEVAWTLGPAAGFGHTVTASAAGLPPVQFTASGGAGTPALAAAAAGDNQTSSRRAQVPVPPRVRVTDRFGNPRSHVEVAFAVTSGGGYVDRATQMTDAEGTAAVAWTLGDAPGTNTLTATFPGTPVAPVVFSATGITTVGHVAINTGGFQAAMAGRAVPIIPSVLVYDGSGTRLSGVAVTFAVTSGGGTVTGASATTDANGIARVSGWVLGPAATLNTLTATVAGFNGTPPVLRAAGCAGDGPGFDITVCIASPMTASQRQVFQAAAARWGRIIKGDLPDVTSSIPFGSCGPGTPAADQTFDDVFIFASVIQIDGPGQVLGQAGPCYLRGGTGGLPVIGVMQFDQADVDGLEAEGQLSAVILHEMGHVLGIGTLWSRFGLLQSASSASAPLDTYFNGAGGRAGFNAIGGATYTGGQKVPVENTGGAGTMNSHWRESVLLNELMTGYLDTGANPLSVLTARSLADLGYTVDAAAADNFFLTLSLRAPGSAPASRLRLHNDIYTGPQYTLDRRGRRERIR